MMKFDWVFFRGLSYLNFIKMLQKGQTPASNTLRISIDVVKLQLVIFNH